MLTNKWIISDKESIPTKSGYLYTIILVDCDKSLFKTEQDHIYSEKNLHIGAFVDSQLNPLTDYFKPEYCDTAKVVFTHTYNVENQELKRVSFFSAEYGCFDTFMHYNFNNFSMSRGDEISVLIRNEPESRLNTNNSRNFFTFRVLQNLTTNQKNPYSYDIDDFNGDFQEFFVVGIGSAGTKQEPSKKYMLINSPRFGYISMIVSSKDTLFFTRPNDELLVERNPKTDSYEVLRNITADNMRAAYILNQR